MKMRKAEMASSILIGLAFIAISPFAREWSNKQQQRIWRNEGKAVREIRLPESMHASRFPRKILDVAPFIEREYGNRQDSADLAFAMQKAFEVPFPKDMQPLSSGEIYQNWGQFISTNIDTVKIMGLGFTAYAKSPNMEIPNNGLNENYVEVVSIVVHEARHNNLHFKQLWRLVGGPADNERAAINFQLRFLESCENAMHASDNRLLAEQIAEARKVSDNYAVRHKPGKQLWSITILHAGNAPLLAGLTFFAGGLALLLAPLFHKKRG